MINKLDWSFEIADRVHSGEIIPWDELCKLFPILEEMKSIGQSKEYHGEGNVFNHTKMVVESLVGDFEWLDLSKQNASALFLSALFHDVGKIETTVEEKGVFSSSGHSAKGARIVRNLLRDVVPFEIREYICNMVLLHMLPVYFIEKEDPLYSICASSYTLINRDLDILANADCNGRICGNNNSLDAIKIFGDFCEENECLEFPKRFLSDHSRFLYFFERKGHPNLNRYHDCKGTVHIMSGLPGAGKDFYIKKNLSHLPSVGLDDIRDEQGVGPLDGSGRVYVEAKERCRQNMREGKDFVFNATNFLKQTRARWIRLFNDYNYRVEIHYLEPLFSVLMKQNLSREKKVPEGIVGQMFEKLEPPTLLECHKLIIG